MMRRAWLARFAPVVLVAAAAFVSPQRALAQDREADAERLFREGQKLLEERRFGEACPKFEQAYKKDGQLGTLLNLAFCHKEQGATWYAWLEFREAEIKATELGRSDRRDFAKGQLPALEKSLSKLVVDNPKDIPLVEVLVEDKRIPEAEKGAPFAAEAGQRKLTFRAKGDKVGTLLVNLPKSEKITHVTVPDMADDAVRTGTGSGDPQGDGVESTATIPEARAETPSTQSSQKTLALGAFGVAAVGGLVMIVAGIMTLTNDCAALGDSANCVKDAEGKGDEEKSRGDTTGMIANIGGAVMLVGGAAGAFLWFTAPKEAENSGGVRVKPQLGLGYAGLRGTF
jgi:hypothetical protein